MNSGMYAALSGNVSALKRMDIITNNLANANTAGYRKEKMSFEGMLAGAVNPPAVPQSSTADPILQRENVYIDYSPGPVSQSGNTFDLAIDGDGFFVIGAPEGPAYTRQGNFRLSGDGTLVTSDGYPVMSSDGQPFRINQGSRVEIDHAGIVTVDGEPAGSIGLVDFQKPYSLVKKGSTLFVPASDAEGGAAQPATAKGQIRQGHLEGSNVETISEMVQMIETNRYFDTCQRIIRGFDDMASKAANELGRL